jgi:peptidoglycan/xylan/chitin deacetylase (PgdA/CDA1 family)
LSRQRRAPSILRTARLTVLKTLDAVGLDDSAMLMRWRQNRVLIIGYHGISIDDEHLWDPELYMRRSKLQRRLELIRETRCHVLPLDEAVRRMYAGNLPPRSVVLTFDDGMHDFYACAFPITESFGFPATVYLTTYYAEFNRPVYDAMVSYLLWKARGRVLRWPDVLGGTGQIALTDEGRQLAMKRLRSVPGRTATQWPRQGRVAGAAGRATRDRLQRHPAPPAAAPDELARGR